VHLVKIVLIKWDEGSIKRQKWKPEDKIETREMEREKFTADTLVCNLSAGLTSGGARIFSKPGQKFNCNFSRDKIYK
jgi:hypothetical protein